MTDVHVELNPRTNRIELRCDYYVGVNVDCKKIQGRKFHPEEKIWSYPARMQTCHALRGVFKDRLKIGPILTTWARRNSKLYSTQRSLASKPDSELALVRTSHPLFWQAMSSRPYQRSGAEFLSITRHAADFSEPGLGKTATALASLIQAGNWNGRHLVIVSNKTAIKSTWAEEIKKWAPDAKAYPMPEGQAKRCKVLDEFWDDEEGPRFLIMLPHMVMIKQGHWCKKCAVWQEEAQSKKQFDHEEEQEDGSIKIVKKKVEIPTEHYAENHKWVLEDMKCDWPELFEEPWDSIIADECHDYLLKLRDPRAKNQPQWAVGMRRLPVKHGGSKIPITGTPMRGKLVHFFGIFHWLDPVRFPSFWGWAETYFNITQNEYNRTVGDLRPDMEQQFFDILDSLALRRTKLEVRKELPPLVPQEHWVELEGEHQRQYQEFLDLGEATLESGTLQGQGRLSELTRLKQMSFGEWDVEVAQRKPSWEKDGNGKIDWEDFQKMVSDGWMIDYVKMVLLPDKSPKVELVLNMLRERGALEPIAEQPEDSPKFIIASQFTQIIKGMREMLTGMGVPSLEITGSVTGVMRSLAVKSFQSPGGPKIMLLNTRAGGASLTLDKFCDDMFVMDETWTHDDQVQLMGRIDNRSGEIRPRFIHFIRTKGTIDEDIAVSNDDQNEMERKILDSRRGNVYALSLISRS